MGYSAGEHTFSEEHMTFSAQRVMRRTASLRMLEGGCSGPREGNKLRDRYRESALGRRCDSNSYDRSAITLSEKEVLWNRAYESLNGDKINATGASKSKNLHPCIEIDKYEQLVTNALYI